MEIVDIVNELFQRTTLLVETPSGDSEAAESKKVPRQQLPELAACLFRCIQERLDWLGRWIYPSEHITEATDASIVLAQRRTPN